jgi:hypothetical protein
MAGMEAPMGRGSASSGGSRRDPRKDIAQGFVLGAVLYMALWALRVPKAFLEFDHGWGVLVSASAWAVVYATRLRWLFWTLAGMTAALFVLVSMTPVFPRAARGLIRRDGLRRADVVVVLGSATTRERKLDETAFIRMVDGMQLIHDGWAETLIWTRVGGAFPRADDDVERLADLCGNPKIESVGPVNSTRDEAVRVAQVAQERGWKTVILVTSPYHSARASAAFRRTGLTVISRPSVEREFAPSAPRSNRERVEVFRWWLYEQVRWLLYRARGWV